MYGYTFIPLWCCACLRITGVLRTVTGGLTAVIYTDTLQAVLMIGGALSLMAKGQLAVRRHVILNTSSYRTRTAANHGA